jgi:hypothetical protein
MRGIVWFLFYAYTGSSAVSAPRPRHETITGLVVAYTMVPSCLNGNGYWEMVIRVHQSKAIRSEFVRVVFSLPCGTTPDWVSAEPLMRKFRLERNQDCDGVLERFMATEPKQGLTIPLWKQPPGAEHVTLPFGQTIPCYRSVDMPLAPAL